MTKAASIGSDPGEGEEVKNYQEGELKSTGRDVSLNGDVSDDYAVNRIAQRAENESRQFFRALGVAAARGVAYVAGKELSTEFYENFIKPLIEHH